MAIQKLELLNFRIYPHFSVDISSGVTIFTGKNGAGKTSILEAVSLLGSGRSFRTARSQDFIHNGCEYSTLQANINSGNLDSQIRIQIHPNGKKVSLDGKQVKSNAVLVQKVPSIAFSPADHQIIEGDSSQRRAFLNRAMSYYSWEFAENLTVFNKNLLQRNALLKKIKEGRISYTQGKDQIPTWNEGLVLYGAKILFARQQYIQELSFEILTEYRKISFTDQVFSTKYCPFGDVSIQETHTEEDWRFSYQEILDDSLSRDLAAGSTQEGPHRDELEMTLNCKSAKYYGSQGEKRTCALALRLGELTLFRGRNAQLPILLFDDISSELDSIRRKSLVELLTKEQAQVLMTATELPLPLLSSLGLNFEHIDLMELGVRANGDYGKNRVELHS